MLISFLSTLPLKKRLLISFIILTLLAVGIPTTGFIMAGWDQWKLQEPKYPVGIEHEAISLINIPRGLLIKAGYDREGPASYFLNG